MDATGLSSGLLSSWNPLLIRCKDFISFVGILLKANFKGFNEAFSIINCYGPYSHRIDFWEKVGTGVLFNLPNLLLAGDLNFTLSSFEIWGPKARPNPLSPFFSRLLTYNNLINLNVCSPSPTWRNGRIGEDGFSKRLDRLVISE